MKKAQRIARAMTKNKGRIFGLTTTNGTEFNARFVHETPSYVTVYDNNAKRERKLHKTSLAKFRSGTTVI